VSGTADPGPCTQYSRYFTPDRGDYRAVRIPQQDDRVFATFFFIVRVRILRQHVIFIHNPRLSYVIDCFLPSFKLLSSRVILPHLPIVTFVISLEVNKFISFFGKVSENVHLRL
jgi:hypothetical protein